MQEMNNNSKWQAAIPGQAPRQATRRSAQVLLKENECSLARGARAVVCTITKAI